MNVLLTGGTGYIGSHTAVVLAAAGHEVVLYDNLSNSDVAVVDRVEQISGKRPSFVQGDIRDSDHLRKVLSQHRVQVVIHFAGLKAVGESVHKPIEYFANNVSGTVSLLEAMQAEGVKQLVFSSSATVYGEPQYLPLNEQHPTSATNPYGRCKLHIEEILRDVHRSDPEWQIVCLRYFNPVGAHASGLIGESPNGVPNNLMPFIAQVAQGLRPELQVFGDDYATPDGTGVRDYIHVMDLAEGHRAAIEHLAEKPGWTAINLGTGRGFSVLEMVRAFEVASQRSVPFQITPRRPGDVAECYANPNKAKEMLGWSAKHDLAAMCASTWRYQVNISADQER